MSKPETEVRLISLEALAGNVPSTEDKIETIDEQIKKAQIPLGKVEDNLGFNSEEEEENEENNQPKDDLGTTPPVITPDNNSNDNDEPAVESEESKRFKAILKNTFGDLGVIEQEIEGEVVEFSIDDIEMDSETFESLVAQKIEQEREAAQSGKISVEGISDITKAMIEVDKNGGDLGQLLNVKQSYYDPLSQIDTTTDQGKMEVVALRLSAQGLSPDQVEIQLSGVKAKGILDEVAEKAETELKALMNQAIENEKQKAQAQALALQEERKKYKSSLKQSLSNFQLKDTVKNKVVEMATKIDEKGMYEIDKLYGEAMKDPDKAAKLTLFLLDEKEYEAQITDKKITAEKINQLGRLKLLAKKGSQVVENKRTPPEKGLIPLENL